MQAASSPYLPPYYQGLYHIPHLGSHQDYELKRQYLALLSPQQIIEICLTFDVHVSPYVKSTIWPQDLNAAIAGLRKSTTNAPNDNERAGRGDESSSPSSSRKDANDSTGQEPIMASLDRPPEGSVVRAEGSGERAEERSTEKQLEENVSATSATTATATTTAPVGGSTQTPTTSAVASTSTSATPVPASSPPAPPPVSQQQQQQPAYPHQPYSYPQHTTAAYPHAPYYPPPPGYPGYPTSSYPHYPQPLPNGYPTAPGGYPNPYSAPTPSHSQSSSLHYPPLHPHHSHQDQSQDDLPSYEEMIVEALQESGSTDPEGCAPKDLFSWMAVRYPLQSNFRPSASQALQKAFKRGRLEKNSNGKYRLNVTWEGGSTSRRTTRRPQSQSNAPPPPASSSSSSHLQPPPSGSPFTHAPLVHHHHHHANSQQQQQHNSGYPYAYGYPGYAQHPTQQQHLQQQSTSLTDAKGTTGDKTTINANAAAAMLDDSDRDAYEAAQNILKAINFGDLLQIAQNEEGGDGDTKKASSSSLSGGGGDGGGEVSMDQLTSLLIQAQHAISSQQQSMEGQQQQQQQQQQQAVAVMGMNSSLASVTPLPTLSATAGVAVASTSTLPSTTLTSNGIGSSASVAGVNVRAELQAQLALLAVQLAELGQESEGGAGGGGAASTNGTVAQLLQQGQNGIVTEPRCEDVGRREEQGVDGGGSMAVPDSEGPLLIPPRPPPAPPQPPMNGLLPLSSNPDMNSSSDVSGSSEARQLRVLQGRRDGSGEGGDDIPIDPVLRDVGAVPDVGSLNSAVTSPITTTTTAITATSTMKTPVPTAMMVTTNTTPILSVTEELEQRLPPVGEKITGSGPTVSDVTMTTAVSVPASVAASVPPVDRGREEEERRLGDAIPSVMMGGGGGGDSESDDSDDDMEEII